MRRSVPSPTGKSDDVKHRPLVAETSAPVAKVYVHVCERDVSLQALPTGPNARAEAPTAAAASNRTSERPLESAITVQFVQLPGYVPIEESNY
jgi:hypothetical protein